MSESIIPEGAMPEPEKPKKHGRAKVIDPLISSVPTLIGVLVGAITSHVAEMQKVDFEREDRFRHEQVERVASVAHGYDSLTAPLTGMISAIQTRQALFCRHMPAAAAAENMLRNSNLLHGRLFSAGAIDPSATAQYGAEITKLTTNPDQNVRDLANGLNAMIGAFTTVLASVETAEGQFLEKREAFQATLMFEVKVYFPNRIRKDVEQTTDAFTAIAKQATSVQMPNQYCRVDADTLSRNLITLDVRAAREMTSFAQSLEPELGEDSAGGKS